MQGLETAERVGEWRPGRKGGGGGCGERGRAVRMDLGRVDERARCGQVEDEE